MLNPSKLAPCIVVAPHATENCPILEFKGALETGTHFSLDIGIKEFALSFADEPDLTVVLGDVGRLAIDLNRDLDEAFFSPRPASVPFIEKDQDREFLKGLYADFHARVASETERHVNRRNTPLLVELHSYTRMWNGTPRKVDVGVCDHRLDAMAHHALKVLKTTLPEGLSVCLDEPYPGAPPGAFFGRTYHKQGAKTVVFEVCDDLIDTEPKRNALLPHLKSAIQTLRSPEYMYA